MDRNDPIPRDHGPPELKLTGPVDERWIRAHRAFITLTKTATTRVLRHFDETRTPVVIVYASDWAISASLTQEHDGIYHPVAFASRTLKTNELNYNVTEKEVLALLRILDLYYNLLVGREIRSALLVPWTLEITKCTKDEDEILGAIVASITPRAKIDDDLTEIAPRKELKRRIQAPIPTVNRDEELWVISIDGSARVKRGGARSARSRGVCLDGRWSRPDRGISRASPCFAEMLRFYATLHWARMSVVARISSVDWMLRSPLRMFLCAANQFQLTL
ncbi:reverse transcriptase [Phytophthora megakarya]|uniref:Reverse transcriptase n=1 Tax=Phytophthora megakarya TaxID=4795 RepID=A0A225W0T0_9STRA|nr:reverse transcriptase [Phytophthora megakarya]